MPGTDHTPSGGDDPVVDALWNAHRGRMLDIAFRILLDLGDAEDVVQEAFSRLARTDVAVIDDPEAWLVVVTSRLCVCCRASLCRHWIGRSTRRHRVSRAAPLCSVTQAGTLK